MCSCARAGSSPVYPPIYTRLDNWSVGGAPTSCSVGSIPTARAILRVFVRVAEGEGLQNLCDVSPTLVQIQQYPPLTTYSITILRSGFCLIDGS